MYTHTVCVMYLVGHGGYVGILEYDYMLKYFWIVSHETFKNCSDFTTKTALSY